MAKDSIDNYKEVTEAQKISLEATATTYERPPQSFIDAWNNACINKPFADMGKFNEATGYFELNGIKDIPYSEALLIYNNAQRKTQMPNSLIELAIRTNLIMNPRESSPRTQILNYTFCNETIQVARVAASPTTECVVSAASWGFFCKAYALREVIGILNISNLAKFEYCLHTGSGLGNVETIYIKGIHNSDRGLRFAYKINYASMAYLVNNATNTAAITITVHANVYAKLTGDTTNAAAAALTEEEAEKWQALVEAAANKNITFVSA